MAAIQQQLQTFIAIKNSFDSVFVFTLFAGISLFVVSLFSPAFYAHTGTFEGYWILSLGWLGLLFFQLAWLSNPLSLIAILIAKERPLMALLLSMLALVVATQSFLLFELPLGFNQEKIYIREMGIGFYLWYSAHMLFVIALLANFFGMPKTKKG